MRFFDAHCDTVHYIRSGEGDFAGGKGMHVTLPGMLEAGMAAQVFAAFAAEAQHPGRAFETVMDMLGTIRAMCEEHDQELVLATGFSDIAQAYETEGLVAIVPGVEGAAALEGKVENLEALHGAGARILTIAWDDSPFCGATFGKGGGLTDKGKDLVGMCEDLGVVVDVSHVSDEAFWDVCAAAKRPFVASHSDCRALSGFTRNLTDDMIRRIGELGGVMGINMGSSFLSAEFYAHEKASMEEFFRAMNSGEQTFADASNANRKVTDGISRPPLDLIAAHVKHAINKGGEDCVGLGGDLDGVENTPEGMDGVQDYPKIASLLLDAGVSEAQVQKVCFGNFARVFREVMG